MVSLGYALSRLVVRTRFAFLKTCGGVNVVGSTCLDSSGWERLSSALAKLESAAMQLVKREDLIVGTAVKLSSHVRSMLGELLGQLVVTRRCVARMCCVVGVLFGVPWHLRVLAQTA
jgi:hypothetical protein